MIVIGRRSRRPLSLEPSAERLKEGAFFNESLQRLPTGDTTFMRKGVYRFRSLEEADRHREECLARGMAKQARKRS